MFARNLDSMVHRAVKAVNDMMQIVQSSAIEADISCLFGFQLYSLGLVVESRWVPTVSPLVSMMKLLPKKPLRRHKTCSHYPGRNWSAAWIFAATILRPDFLAELAGFSTLELLFFSRLACQALYWETAQLLRKAKTASMDSVKEDWAALNDDLETIYCLITYHNVQASFTSQFSMAVDRSITLQFQFLNGFWRGYKSDAGEIPTVVSKANAEKLKRDLEHLNKNIKIQQLNLSDFLKSVGGEGWTHLQAFIRHWLVKLGGGHKRYSEVMMKHFLWNTLCRIDHKDEVEDEGKLPPSFYDYFHKNVLAPAFAKLLSLHPRGYEAPKTSVMDVSCDLSSLFKDSMDRSSILCYHECSWWSLECAGSFLDDLEEEVTQLEARKGSNKPKDCRVLFPDYMPNKPSLTKPQLNEFERAMTDLREFGKP